MVPANVVRLLLCTAVFGSFGVGPASARTVKPPGPAARAPLQILPTDVQPLTPEVERTLRPRDSFRECGDCPEMVVVPAGAFMMGTPAQELERFDEEFPPHRVTLSRPLAVGRFKISFDDWDACLKDGGCDGRRGDDGGHGRGRLPAAGISFEAATSYLAWLSRKTGRTYRLPSEAEREYFARAGTTTPFWFGRTISAEQANFKASIPYGRSPRGVDSKGPQPVDRYPANAFGLYQVHGNGWEWTEDCYNKRLTQDAPTDGRPWLEGDCQQRVVRGGPWDWWANMLRSGYRYGVFAGGGYGFRVVRSLN